MTYSPYPLVYLAHQLTRRAASHATDRMAGALLDARVDLNPRQIDTALFATSKGAATLADKLQVQKKQHDLEGRRDKKRRELFNRQDEIQARRDQLIDELESQLDQKITQRTLFGCE